MGLTLHIADTGAGPPVLLLHAYPQDGSMWDHQVATLSSRYRCLRPDMPGCGQSPDPDGAGDVDAVAAATLAALDERGVSRCAVVGASMGGAIALAMARRARGRVAGVALVGARAAADGDNARAERTRLAADLRARGVPALEDLVEPSIERLLAPASREEFHISDPVRGRIRRARPEGLAYCQEAMAARPDDRALCGALAVPVLLIVGRADTVIPPDEVHSLASAIPGADLTTVDAAGHLVSLERPGAVTSALDAWLTAVWAQSARARTVS